MTDCTLDSSPVEWLLDHPETEPLFEELGIDRSCAGKSLDFACRRQGLDPVQVLRRLHRSIEARRAESSQSDPRAADDAPP